MILYNNIKLYTYKELSEKLLDEYLRNKFDELKDTDITFEELCKTYQNTVFTTKYFAAMLIEQSGYVKIRKQIDKVRKWYYYKI
jgi:hypothetical protein